MERTGGMTNFEYGVNTYMSYHDRVAEENHTHGAAG